MDLTGARWHKSSYSNGNSTGDGCVEVAFLPHSEVARRDTKDRSRTAHRYPTPAWHAFLAAIRAGEFLR
ncbi:MAG TPA: DUF397 domain-containing protein [Pseudonocardia sp.]|uniref:DUF397 domain-containing protein n=1 Tax=Pseudonocardia sp. TaxID=60912 RepID=UPI002F40D28A